MSLFELCNAIIIYLHIFYLCLLRLLFFSLPVTFYHQPVALSRPFARASVHYNVKNTQERPPRGGEARRGTFSIYNESKIAGGSSNASRTELTEVISNTLGWIYIFRRVITRERREIRRKKGEGARGATSGRGGERRRKPIINLLMRGERIISKTRFEGKSALGVRRVYIGVS